MRLLAYALPALAIQFVYVPVTTLLPGIYAKSFGVSAGFLAAALLVSRVVDAVTDPLVGHYSDASRSTRFGRKAWLAAGTLLTTATLFVVTGDLAAAYPHAALLLGTSLFFLGWTMMEVPHAAWGAEIAPGHQARNHVFFLRTVLGMVGALGVAAVPYLVAQGSSAMTPTVLQAIALIFALVAPLLVLPAVWFASPGTTAATATGGIVASLTRVVGNRLIWRLFAGFTLAGIAAGSVGALQFIFVDTYLGLGEHLPLIMAVTLLCGAAGLPAWLLVMKRMDKHRAWSMSLLLACGWVSLPVLLAPGEDTLGPYLAICAGLALSSGAGAIAPFALLGDIAEYGAWKSGWSQTATYFALFTFLVKVNAAIGGSLGFAVLAVTGYDASSSHHGALQIAGVKFAVALVPASLFCLAALSLWGFPLDRRRHGIVQRALARRSGRTA